MPKKKRTNKEEVSVHAGRLPGDSTTDAPPPKPINQSHGVHIGGHVNIAGGDITVHHQTSDVSMEEINQLFSGLYQAIEARANTTNIDKEDLKAEVKEIQTFIIDSAQKNVEVDEAFLLRRFRNIAHIAPDVLEILVTILGNVLVGFGLVSRKLAGKAKIQSNEN